MMNGWNQMDVFNELNDQDRQEEYWRGLHLAMDGEPLHTMMISKGSTTNIFK